MVTQFKHPDLWEIIHNALPIMTPLIAIAVLAIIFHKFLQRFLDRRSVRFNLTFISVAMLGLAAGIGGISEYYMAKVGAYIVEIAEEDIPLTAIINEAEVAQLHQAIYFERFMLYQALGNQAKQDEADANRQKTSAIVMTKLSKALDLANKGDTLAHNDDSKQEFQKLTQELQDALDLHKVFANEIEAKLSSIKSTGKIDVKLLAQLEKKEDHLNKVIEDIFHHIESYTLKTAFEAERSEIFAEYKILAVLIWGMLMSIYLSISVAQSLTSKLRVSSNELGEVVDGIGQLTSDLAQASTSLSASSESSMTALEQTLASMRSISEVSNLSYTSVVEVSDRSDKIAKLLVESNERIKELIAAIDNLGTANDQLTNIRNLFQQVNKKTDSINDIVFKTQLLAINAAIEASSAGEHGKGFSVVANEVGTLANSSGKMAEEIDELLEKSLTQVDQTLAHIQSLISSGAHQTSQVAELFSSIDQEINEINVNSTKMKQISSTQKEGIAEINTALSDIGKQVRDNTSLAEQVGGSSANLTDQKHNLDQVTHQITRLVNDSKDEPEFDETEKAA